MNVLFHKKTFLHEEGWMYIPGSEIDFTYIDRMNFLSAKKELSLRINTISILANRLTSPAINRNASFL